MFFLAADQSGNLQIGVRAPVCFFMRWTEDLFPVRKKELAAEAASPEQSLLLS
jgi:hypothetical protein